MPDQAAAEQQEVHPEAWEQFAAVVAVAAEARVAAVEAVAREVAPLASIGKSRILSSSWKNWKTAVVAAAVAAVAEAVAIETTGTVAKPESCRMAAAAEIEAIASAAVAAAGIEQEVTEA